MLRDVGPPRASRQRAVLRNELRFTALKILECSSVEDGPCIVDCDKDIQGFSARSPYSSLETASGIFFQLG